MISIAFAFGFLGAFFGSFAGAQVWRLRARQLVEDQAHGEKVSQKELVQLKKLIRPVSGDRSECLRCHQTLAWYDLVPIASWVGLGGRCRYCKKPIGTTELLVELALGIAFGLSYYFWPVALDSAFAWTSFVLWLSACVLMTILFVYDARWYLLPFAINLSLIGVGLAFALVQLWGSGWELSGIASLMLALVFLAGLYYIFSLFGWVGLGDSILGVGLALLLGTWQHSLLALFLANLLGCLFLLPLALRGRLKRNMHIPFGPFLILGAVIAVLWGDKLIFELFRFLNTSL